MCTRDFNEREGRGRKETRKGRAEIKEMGRWGDGRWGGQEISCISGGTYALYRSFGLL